MRQRRKKERLPFMVASDGEGNVFEIPGLLMAGRRCKEFVLPDQGELIPLPDGSSLFELPGRVPVGYDPRRKRFVPIRRYKGRPVIAVAAFMAPAHTHLLLCAFTADGSSTKLPLFAYTSVGWRKDRFYVAAKRVDPDIRQDLALMDEPQIERAATRTAERYKGNRLVQHLVTNCVRRYRCPAARNFVLGRWECPVPTSISCNAGCLGCISLQPKESGVPVTQERMTFVPTVDEIVEFTVPHLNNAPRPIISFGQGCEGEPLLQGELIEAAISKIRSITSRGTINLNTNASRPRMVERLCRAGLDSIRVSMNSAQADIYHAYYSPRGYTFDDVLESIGIARRHDKWISLNYFIFPGLTDNPSEIDALVEIVRRYRVDYIQMRNLNIDPDWYVEKMELSSLSGKPVGILAWQRKIKKAAPWIRFGYFNPPKEDWERENYR